MKKSHKIKLNEIRDTKAVEEAAKRLDGSQPKTQDAAKLWSKPFIASGAKPGAKPRF